MTRNIAFILVLLALIIFGVSLAVLLSTGHDHYDGLLAVAGIATSLGFVVLAVPPFMRRNVP